MQPDLLNAFRCPCFPCNPLPFLRGLADHVRENGTDSIKSDEAKAVLWILIGQAYGQLATVDMNQEWDRLDNTLPQPEQKKETDHDQRKQQ